MVTIIWFPFFLFITNNYLLVQKKGCNSLNCVYWEGEPRKLRWNLIVVPYLWIKNSSSRLVILGFSLSNFRTVRRLFLTEIVLARGRQDQKSIAPRVGNLYLVLASVNVSVYLRNSFYLILWIYTLIHLCWIISFFTILNKIL